MVARGPAGARGPISWCAAGAEAVSSPCDTWWRRMQTPRQITVAALVEPGELRAASFIVTLYGDVVEPRGGLLWMGTLVEVCALVGISETRVRTAVSRLVAAGRLEGTREGRRSYYRLTEAARREFAAAAALVFAPPPRPAGWLIAEGEAGAGLRGARGRAGDRAGRRGAARRGGSSSPRAGGRAGRRSAASPRSAGASRRRPRPTPAFSPASRRSAPRRRRRRRRASSPARSSCTPSAAWCCATRGCPPRRCPADWPEARARGALRPALPPALAGRRFVRRPGLRQPRRAAAGRDRGHPPAAGRSSRRR